MSAVPAKPEGAWNEKVAKAIKEIVEGQLKQYHPRFKGVIVSVKPLNVHNFCIEMQGEEGTFDEDSRDILRKFFTEDFTSRVKPLLRDYLRWKCEPKVYTTARNRRTDCHTWQVARATRRKKRPQSGPPAQLAQHFRVR